MISRSTMVAVLALALALGLTGSAPIHATQTEWQAWLERDAGTPPVAARCVTGRAFASLPTEVLDAAPRDGFSSLPGGWRERISQIYIACVVETG